MSIDTHPDQLSSLEKRHVRSHIRSTNAATVMFIAMTILALALTYVVLDKHWDNGTDTVSNTSTSHLALSLDNGGGNVLIDGGDTQTDPYGIPFDITQDPGDIQNGTPFYDSIPGSPQMVQVVSVIDGCRTKHGLVWIHVIGLTPNGDYTAQTDWTNTGRYGYGDGRYADYYGQSIYAWKCYDSKGWLLPRGAYPIHITDRTSNFSASITLVVGNPTNPRLNSASPVYYVAPDYGK